LELSWARNVPTNFAFHLILGIFYMPQICDMGQATSFLYSPFSNIYEYLK